MALALAIVQIFNLVEPGIADLITIIRRKNGAITVIQGLDENDAQFDVNMKQYADYVKSHPVTPAAPVAAPVSFVPVAVPAA